jgi:hypothetical protein
MMAHRRLLDSAVQLLYHIINVKPHTAQMLHNLLTGIIRQRLGKHNWIDLHIFNYIDIRRYVKSIAPARHKTGKIYIISLKKCTPN